ncbi:HAUS augmin-like complex subunit 4 [Carcharodon carcharias]|uniref:HAUS augmin-like complex subunit 4 n=1 Tax=Carcharodon carcharias TaxID=13397 RepID=UPI001B7EDDF6|nr:HAUS augmin-like complex subunit 4 [Carcharodon carcharias]
MESAAPTPRGSQPEAEPEAGGGVGGVGGPAIEQLSRAVNYRLPDLNLGSRELALNPKFTKMLLLLTEHLDRTGLSLTVKRDLEKASSELRNQKREWLSAEALLRVLDEMPMEHHVKRWESGSGHGDRQFFETLEKCLVLGRCCRRLDTRETVRGDGGPPLLDLRTHHLQELLPEPQQLQAMRQRLVPEVEKRLRERSFTVLCYYQPEYESNSEVLKTAKSGSMAGMFKADKQRLEEARDRNRGNQVTITNQTIAYLTILSRCFEMLRELIDKHRISSQPELDTQLQEYLRLKSRAMFVKLGLMKLELRHQLFNQDTVDAHNSIRALLLEELEGEQQSAESLRRTLSLYQMLGAEFEGLVSEYGHLRQLLENKKWALEEFSKSQS